MNATHDAEIPEQGFQIDRVVILITGDMRKDKVS